MDNLTYTYDDRNNVLTCTGSNGLVYEFTYAANGEPLTFWSAAGDWCEVSYDQIGNLTSAKGN